jgi:hypothetical protein
MTHKSRGGSYVRAYLLSSQMKHALFTGSILRGHSARKLIDDVLTMEFGLAKLVVRATDVARVNSLMQSKYVA